jgi:hypothetical protein
MKDVTIRNCIFKALRELSCAKHINMLLGSLPHLTKSIYYINPDSRIVLWAKPPQNGGTLHT